MDRKIITFDVSNIPLYELADYMEDCIRKIGGLKPLPQKTKWQKFKRFCYYFFLY